jgi:hypothetical protein
MRLAALARAPASMHEICSSAIRRNGTNGLHVAGLFNSMLRDLATHRRCSAVAAELEDAL